MYPLVCELISGNRREKSKFWQGEWGHEFGCCVGNKSNQQWIKKKILFDMTRNQNVSSDTKRLVQDLNERTLISWWKTEISGESLLKACLKHSFASNNKTKYDPERMEKTRTWFWHKCMKKR